MTWTEAKELFTRELFFYDPGESVSIFFIVAEALTGQPRGQFHKIAGLHLSATQSDRMQQYLERLKHHEPVQYVVGKTWFCGLEFSVDKNVLIPRPETEELVEWVISHCRFPVSSLSILDVGTGSGCIAITLKRRIRKAVVTGIDRFAGALGVAERNGRELGAPVILEELDFLNRNERDSLGSFDVIISNPPYIPLGEKSSMEQNVAAFEPAGALFVPDEDPLVFYRALSEFGKKHLNENGMIYAEMHFAFAEAVEQVFSENGYRTEVKKDLQGKTRMIRAW